MNAVKKFQDVFERYGCIPVCVHTHIVAKQPSCAASFVVGSALAVNMDMQVEDASSFSIPVRDREVTQRVSTLVASEFDDGFFKDGKALLCKLVEPLVVVPGIRGCCGSGCAAECAPALLDQAS